MNVRKSKKKSPKTAPRRRARDLLASRKEILDVAFFEVYSRGFQGVSVDDIVSKTSLTKGAFYHHFPTKNDLGFALIEDVIQPMIIERWIKPLNEFENPIEGILQLLKKLFGNASPYSLKLGCPLNNLVQEMAPVDKGFQKRLQKALQLWIDEMDLQLQRAKKHGFLKPGTDTHQVATFLVMAHEGFYGILKGLNDPRLFGALYASLEAYLGTLAAS